MWYDKALKRDLAREVRAIKQQCVVQSLEDDNGTSASHWNQVLGGLQHAWRMYELQAKWYMVAGANTFLQPDHLVAALGEWTFRLACSLRCRLFL